MATFTAWSFVGALSQVGTFFFVKVDPAGLIKKPPPDVLSDLRRGRPEWYLPLLSAALRHWDVLAAEGQRYTPAPLGMPRDFTRAGDDILLDLPITIDEAVLGGKVEVPTATGRVQLTIPKGTC